MEIPIKYITTGVSGGFAHGLKTVIYALDTDGMMWYYERKLGWQRIDNPRTGAGKDRPDLPHDDHIPTHNDL